MSLHHNLLWPR